MSLETFPKVPKNKVGGMVQTAISDDARKIVVAPNADATYTVTFEWPDAEPGSAQNPPGAFASQESFPAVPKSEVGGLVQTAVNDGSVGIVAENKLNGTFSVLVNWPAAVPGGLIPATRAFATAMRSVAGTGRLPTPQAPLKILCVHGVGHHEADPLSERGWRDAIQNVLNQAGRGVAPEIEFVAYDDLFAADPITPGDIAEALLKLGASGIVHGVGDLIGGLFGRARGFGDLTDKLRWTGGMVVQWAENEQLRRDSRRRVQEHTARFQPDLILAHSLGSLIAYDAFARKADAPLIGGRVFVSFGSQIGNPFVRSSVAFNGRIEPLREAKHWFHLFNKHDNVFTARIRISAPNFTQVETEFDDPGIMDHEATHYLAHPNARDVVWRNVAGGDAAVAKSFGAKRQRMLAMGRAFNIAAAKPKRRALLVGINDYPDPANRLEGCVNDVFLMSSVLQESGFAAEDIRVVLNERATAQGILERLEWLLDGAGDGQHRVFYYSGHGAQIPGYGVGEKVDHDDECLVAHDFDWSREHAVTDDQFHELYSQLPYKTNFLTVLDCCHSGGMARDGALRARGINPPDDIRHRLLRWDKDQKMWRARTDDPEAMKSVQPAQALKEKQHERFFGVDGITRKLGSAALLRREMDPQFAARCKELGHHGPYMPVILKACLENEYAYEYRHGVVSHGAFTYALAQRFREERSQGISWNELMKRVRLTLHELKYAQRPEAEGPGSVLKKKIPWR